LRRRAARGLESRLVRGEAEGMTRPQAATDASVARQNLRGIAAMLLAVACFGVMDACLKILSPHYPPLQVVALRGWASMPLILAWVALRGGGARLLQVRFGLHLFRAVIGIGMLAAFTWALRDLPLAEAYTVFFVAPLMITALSVPLLGERVGLNRWWAIGVGFLGVLIVLRPTGAGVASLAGVAVLLAAVAYAISAITVRVLSRTDTTMSMVFWLTSMLAVFGTLVALPEWRPVLREDWLVLALLGVSGTFGQYAITVAFARGQASVVAPFEYTALAWGLAVDGLIWSTRPQLAMLLGAAVIIASGLYLIRHERVHVEAEKP
jgi:drug/metabolite transporter (DMT)-like permease